MKNQKILSLIIIVLLITSINVCSATQNTPSPSNKAVIKNRKQVTFSKEELINLNWWNRFNDPVLTEYIDKAAAINHDLKMASLRVEEYRQLVKQSLGRELPNVGLGFNFERFKLPAELISPDYMSVPAVRQNMYGFPLTANYELDLFLKNRKKTQAAAKELEAMKYDEKAIYIALTSGVATTYFNILKLDKLIEMQKEIISLREKKYDLYKERNKYGLSSTTDLIREETALSSARTELTDLEKYQSIFLNQLAVLTSDTVADSLQLKRSSIDNIELIKDLPDNVEPETVLNRPDVLKSEAQLQKAKINIDIARREFLPTISISGQFGFNAYKLSKVFDWRNYIAVLGTSVAQSLFSGGQKISALKASKIRYDLMFESYQKNILTSFQEINDSLVTLKADKQKNDDSKDRLRLQKDNLDLINAKYQEGAMSFLDTLEHKERMLLVEKEFTQTKTDCLVDSLSLYKAAGGKL